MKIKIEFELDHNETTDVVTVFAHGIQKALYDLNDTLRERRGQIVPSPIFGGGKPIIWDEYFVIKVQHESGISYLGAGSLSESATDEDVLTFMSQLSAEQFLSENNHDLSTMYPDHAFSIIQVQ